MPDYRSRKKLKKERRRTEGRRFAHTTVDTIPSSQKRPAFSLDHLQDNYCITLCDDVDQLAFVNTLRKLSKLSWNQIRNADRHGLGSEKIHRTSLNVTIPLSIGADVTFIALRFSGLMAMVGYQEGRLLHIVWFDRDFNVYNH